MLFLNEKDILKCLSFEGCMDAIEKSYGTFYKNDYFMPPRPCIEKGDDTLLYMPCFIPGVFGTKFLTLFPNNRQYKKPVIDGLIVLNEEKTGETKAILNGRILTALRTGANGGVGVKYTTKKDATKLGLIGAGVQGFYQMMYACFARDIKTVYIFDAFAKELGWFIDKAKALLPEGREIEFVVADSVETLIKNSEIVICATTSTTPVLPNDPELLKGKNFVAIGSYKPNDRECSDALFEVVDHVYADLDFAKEESGDLLVPIKTGLLKSEDVIQLSDLIYDEKYKDHEIGETTFFKSVGMALFDIAVAESIFEKAVKEGIGTELEL